MTTNSLIKRISSIFHKNDNCSMQSKFKCFISLVIFILISNLLSYFFFMPFFLKNNGKLILSSVEDMYKKDQINSQKDAEKKIPELFSAILDNSDIPTIGNLSANKDKTIIEFFDYQCGHCKQQMNIFNQLISVDKDVKIKLISIPSSQGSFIATNISLFLYKKYGLDKFHKFHSKMMFSEQINKDVIDKSLKEIGLDPKKILEEIKKETSIQVIFEKFNNYAKSLNLTGTPLILMKDKMFPGYLGLEQIKDILNK